jgi:hypothetical protein
VTVLYNSNSFLSIPEMLYILTILIPIISADFTDFRYVMHFFKLKLKQAMTKLLINLSIHRIRIKIN